MKHFDIIQNQWYSYIQNTENNTKRSKKPGFNWIEFNFIYLWEKSKSQIISYEPVICDGGKETPFCSASASHLSQLGEG